MAEKRHRSRKTTTSNFGVSRRENHDATAFYARFPSPDLTKDSGLSPRKDIDEVFEGDSRTMSAIDSASVALVVTSPPYFAGKEYEEAIGSGHIPSSYVAYLNMLEEVLAECARTLEPGGRIAINVANLGRRPYRSLSADVIDILQNKLRLLMRGEVIWQKAKGAAGSCAWGSFQKPANPVLRDLTERIIIASKGRFDRALTARERFDRDLPSESSMFKEEFMEATTDVWEIPPESASRVGHPAPFPVELPERLIHLYTYRGDLVLDPFIGSGTTAVAAIRTERHFAGYEMDPEYVAAARNRVAHEREQIRAWKQLNTSKLAIRAALPAVPAEAPLDDDFQARAVREGRAARELAEHLLKECGFKDIKKDVRFPEGVEVNFSALDQKGKPWFFDVSGGFTSSRPGLKRTDTLWKAMGKAAVLRESHPRIPLVLLTTDRPTPGSSGDSALKVLLGRSKPIYDVIELASEEGLVRLTQYAAGGAATI